MHDFFKLQAGRIHIRIIATGGTPRSTSDGLPHCFQLGLGSVSHDIAQLVAIAQKAIPVGVFFPGSGYWLNP